MRSSWWPAMKPARALRTLICPLRTANTGMRKRGYRLLVRGLLAQPVIVETAIQNL